MKCTVTFSVGEDEITLDLETDQESPLTDQDIIKVLQENPDQRQALCDILHNKLYKQSTITELTLDDILNTKVKEGDKVLKKERGGLLGNCGVEFLRNEFPEVTFPDGVEANVLLINHLSVGKKNIKGRIINSNGQEVFVVSGKRDSKGIPTDILKLASFLQVRQQLEEQSFQFAEDSANYKNLQKIMEARNKRSKKVDNIFDMMLDFIYNKDDYDEIKITTDEGKVEIAYTILNKLNNTIRQFAQRVEYSDDFVNTINQQIKHKDNNKKELSVDGLYAAVKAYQSEILSTLELTSKKKFTEFFSRPSSEIEEELKKVFETVLEGPGYRTLLDTLFSVEPEFTLYFDSFNGNTIYLKSEPKTIQSKYGIEYSSIKSSDIINPDHKGYKIYAYWDGEKRKYIPSRGFLTENTVAKAYDSEEEAINYVNDAVQKQDIKKHSFIDFKFREWTVDENGQTIYDDELDSFVVYSKQALTEGSIIESLDIPLAKNTELHNGEKALFRDDRQNYSTFKKMVESWPIEDSTKRNILSEINNPEKIATFIYKLNETNKSYRGNDNKMLEIVDMIKNANVKYYYVESRSWIAGKKAFRYRVIPTDAIVISNYKADKNFPIITLMDAISQVMSEKFNVKVNMLNAEKTKELGFDPNTDKAFIKDGEIYINTSLAKSTDLMHEYTHLILGVLKADPELRTNYEQLMGIVASTDQGKEAMKKLRNTYTDLSEMDLMEEVFVKLFSGHIMGNINPNLEQIFEGRDRFLRDATKIVFNQEISDLKSFYGNTLQTIFTRFSSDVSALLSESDGLDFSSTRTARQYSKWISEQIKKGEITEKCYG